MDSAPVSPKRAAEEKKTFFQMVSDLIRKYKIFLIVAFAVLAAFLVAILAYTGISSSRINASTQRIERLEDDAATYGSEQDQVKKDELEKALLTGLDEVAAKWPKLFAGQRARATKARIFASKKDWANAEKEWIAAAAARPSSYLAPVALQEAAVAAEERGAPEVAKGYYERLISDYPSASSGVPRARFALGRIAEDSKDFAAAIASYEKIVASYPDSDWTKLAKDRILFINSRGLAQ